MADTRTRRTRASVDGESAEPTAFMTAAAMPRSVKGRRPARPTMSPYCAKAAVP